MSSIDPVGLDAELLGRDRSSLFSREFLILAVATMLFFLSMGAMNPLLPKFVVDELHGSQGTAGWVVGSFAISSLLVRSSFGRLGDRNGARVLMSIGAGLGLLSMAIMAFAHNVPIAVLSRLVMGAAQAALMTGSTVLAISLAPQQRRAEAASYILVAFHLGLGVGPIIGEAVLERSSYLGVWLTLGGLMAASLVAGRVLPYRDGDRDKPRSALLHPKGVAPGIVAAVGIIAFVGFSFLVPLYGRTIGVENIAPVFTVSSITIALARVFFGRLPDRVGPIRSNTIALSLSMVGSVVVISSGTKSAMFIAAAIMAAGMSLQTPSMIAAALTGVPDNERSSAMATFTSFMDVSVALTGPIMGLIVDNGTYREAFIVTLGFTVLAMVLQFTYLAPRLHRISE